MYEYYFPVTYGMNFVGIDGKFRIVITDLFGQVVNHPLVINRCSESDCGYCYVIGQNENNNIIEIWKLHYTITGNSNMHWISLTGIIDKFPIYKLNDFKKILDEFNFELLQKQIFESI